MIGPLIIAKLATLMFPDGDQERMVAGQKPVSL